MKYTLPIGAKLRSPKRTYTIENVLGQGGFGITYKVSANLQVDHVTIRTHFAIKEFFMSEACERDEYNGVCYSSPVKDKVEECRKDFLAEAQRLNKISLEHSNIIHVNEVFEVNNTVYYVMEFLDGGSLRDYVHKHGALSEQEALAIMMPIMQAVEYLHQHKMSHLDIKPDNVMLKKDSETGEIIPVLIDFGLSKHYDKNGKATSTVRMSGFSDGYAPVEQYIGIYTFTPQADVYALASTLYYVLVGKDPVIALEQTEEKLLKSLPDGISDSVKDTILSCMKMRKEERCPSVVAMLTCLSAPLGAAEQTKKEISKKKDNTTRVVVTKKKIKVHLALFSIVILLVCAIICFIYTPTPPMPQPNLSGALSKVDDNQIKESLDTINVKLNSVDLSFSDVCQIYTQYVQDSINFKRVDDEKLEGKTIPRINDYYHIIESLKKCDVNIIESYLNKGNDLHINAQHRNRLYLICKGYFSNGQMKDYSSTQKVEAGAYFESHCSEFSSFEDLKQIEGAILSGNLFVGSKKQVKKPTKKQNVGNKKLQSENQQNKENQIQEIEVKDMDPDMFVRRLR